MRFPFACKLAVSVVGMKGKPSGEECFKFLEFRPAESMNNLLDASIVAAFGIFHAEEEHKPAMKVFVAGVARVLDNRMSGMC